MEQQLIDLVDQMRDLIKVLKATSGTQGTSGSGTDDRNVNRLINALGQLAVKLDGTSRTRAEEQQAMKRFTANVNRATDAQEKQAEQIAKDIAQKKEAARLARMTADEILAEQQRIAQEEAKLLEKKKADERQRQLEEQQDRVRNVARAKSSSQQLFDTYDSLGGTSTILKARFFDLAGSSMTGQVALRAFAAGLEGISKSLTQYTSALYKGERGAQVSAKALTELVTPVTKLIDTLGVIIQVGSFFIPGGALAKGLMFLGGTALGFASKGMQAATKYNEIAAKQSDDLFKSFREISQVGAATAGGMDDVFANLQTLGMTVAEIEEYNKLIVSSGQKLGLLGATAAQGKQAFAEVAGSLVKSDLGRQLEMLGLTATEQREAALTYMSIQARTGQMEIKNTRQLVEESAKFAKELDLSARLTGQTRKEQEAAREANLAESRYRAALFAAQQRGDQAEIARLEKAGSMAAMLRGLGMTEQATGTLQFAASGGAMTTPEAIQAAMSLGLQQVLNDPNITAVQALQQGLGNAKEQLGYLAETNKYIGEVTAIQGNIPKTLDAIIRLEKIQKGAAQEGMTIEEFLSTEQGRMIMAGGNTRLMVEAGRAQQSAAMTMDSVVASFNGAARIHEIAAKTFNDAVTEFAKIVGAKAPTGGTYTTQATSLPAVAPTTPAVQAQVVAAETRELATQKAEQVAAAGDAVKEAQRALETAKKANASKEEQAKIEQRILDAKKEQERLEQEEIKAAREARQRELEARNQRRRERAAANAAKSRPGSAEAPVAPNTPAATATPGGPAPAASATPGAAQAPAGTRKAAVGSPVAPKPAAAVTQAGPGFTTVLTTDNDQQRREGTRSWRNNNPGNIEYGNYALSMGAIGTDGRFAVFPTLEAGNKAKEELLFGTRSNYVNLSIADAISRYAPPTENNTRAYINAVTQAVGVPESTILSQLSPTDKQTFLEAINRVEGFRTGKVLQAAEGGIVPSRPGGTLLQAAEVGYDEAFIPIPRGSKKIPVDISASLRNVYSDLGSVLNDKLLSIDFEKSLTGTYPRFDPRKGIKLADVDIDIERVIKEAVSTAEILRSTKEQDNSIDIAGPLMRLTSILESNIGKDLSPAQKAAEPTDNTGLDVRLLARELASEIRTALRDSTGQNQSGPGSDVIVAAIQEMVREQKTTNTISQRMLQVAQS